MIIDRSREKLANVIIFFWSKTQYCHKIKLFKLLYMLDFEHFKEIGRSVTGLEYFAWPNGPVPVELNDELEAPKNDLKERVQLILTPFRDNKTTLEIYPLQAFNSGVFSKRELDIMNRLVSDFKDHLAEDMIFETHLDNQPWHQVYEVEGKRQAHIPYELALRKQEKEMMLEIIEEDRDFLEFYDSRIDST